MAVVVAGESARFAWESADSSRDHTVTGRPEFTARRLNRRFMPPGTKAREQFRFFLDGLPGS
jgi:hypothetical protein